MTSDPFVVLGVDENAGDDAIKQRYLALVRRHPPDREPDRFQAVRRAYEAIRGYGHVKEKSIADAKQLREQRQDAFRNLQPERQAASPKVAA